MMKLILILTIIAYTVVGFLTFCEYKKKFMLEPKWDLRKISYVGIHGFLYVLIGLFISVLGYLILTM